MGIKYNSIKAIIFKSWTILFGIAIGLMSGLIAMTIIRLVIALLFGWGDSGPEWLDIVLLPLTVVVAVVATIMFVRWSFAQNQKSQNEQ